MRAREREREGEREREREQIEVLLRRIQIYPGDVLPNMQDLFMSASISASHLQTESAASTPSAQPGIQRVSHVQRGDGLIVYGAAATF